MDGREQVGIFLVAERKDELPSTGSGVWLWHVCDREKHELPPRTRAVDG